MTDASHPTELSSRDHSATQMFLFNRTLFQGEHLPPSNAVLPAAPVQGHWTARKGRTTFPFSFRLPSTAPSSVSFGGNANLRYALKATCQTWWTDNKTLVTVRSDAFVVERWHDEFDPRYLEPMEAVADTHIFMGGNGAVWLEAGVAEQLFIAGGMVMIRAGVKNNTKRHLSGIKVAIARRLVFPISGPPGTPAQRPSLEPQITEVIHTQLFKGPTFEFPPNEEMVTNLAVDIPRDLRTIRKTRLFEVQIIVLVSAQMGNFAKDLTVEVPIYVAHSASLQRPASGALEPLRGLPQRSRSAMSQHGHHEHHNQHNHHHHHQQQQHIPTSPYDPHMMTVEAYGSDRGWSPAPYPNAGMGPPSRPSSAAPNVGPAPLIVLPQSPQPFAFSPGQNGQEPQVVWDPHAQGWTASTLLQHTVRPASAQELARSHSAGPEVIRSIPNGALDVHHQRGPTAGSTHLMSNQNRRATAPAYNNLSPQQQQQQQRGSTLAPSPQAQPIPPSSPSLSSPQQNLTPPQQSSITTSQLLSLGAVPVAGLATIEEDSESAAGTVRSIRTLVGSVSRNDIAQFEAMVDEVQDEEEMNQAMQRAGMVPDTRIVDKSLPKAPAAASAKEGTASGRRPRASDLFIAESTPKAEPTRTPARAPQSPEVAAPTRLSSAQGQGLTALESRLDAHAQKSVLKEVMNKQSGIHAEQSTNSARKTDDVVTLGNMPVNNQESTAGSSALRAAAAAAATAERERKRREEGESQAAREKTEEQARQRDREEKRQRREEREREEARQRENRKLEEQRRAAEAVTSDLPAPVHASSASKSPTSSNKGGVGERKAVDVREQKKLNKEAVGRVNGWLSSSPNSSRGVGEESEIDPALSPKTPSPSVLKSVEPEEPLILPSSSSSGLRRLMDDPPATLSADLRALIDGSDSRPTPKQGTAIRSHIGSRRFSGEGVTQESKVQSPVQLPASLATSKVRNEVPNAASRGIPTSRSLGQEDDKKGNGDGDEATRYDARSARGGRGGRVASVANMWASIAEGTDGSKIKSDDVPVLTLKPKALRSGVVGSSALDFSSGKGEAGKKPSAREIFAASPLIANDRIKSPPAKTKKAAHFINTTMPKPVFASTASPVSPVQPAGTRKLSIEREEQALAPGKLKESRKITSDLVAMEAKLKAGRDVQSDDLSDDLLPMKGRGTTKPIGREKLADLRSLWGG